MIDELRREQRGNSQSHLGFPQSSGYLAIGSGPAMQFLYAPLQVGETLSGAFVTLLGTLEFLAVADSQRFSLASQPARFLCFALGLRETDNTLLQGA
ncbi:hypothetical protein JTL62_33595, partial [Pseudomonas aeruginosa]|nr:hypothetical protein [Pseudomonas aeruginosa]